MTQDLTKHLKEKNDGLLSHLKVEFQQIRTSRPNPTLVEDIMVSYGEERFTVKQLAAISILPPSTILIAPWDKNYVEAISKGILASALGVNPVEDGSSIRVNLPSLTEERRLQLVKSAKEKAEQVKISVRRERDDVMKKLQGLEKDKQISEDQKFKLKNDIQKMVDEANAKIEELTKQKEAEIMRV